MNLPKKLNHIISVTGPSIMREINEETITAEAERLDAETESAMEVAKDNGVWQAKFEDLMNLEETQYIAAERFFSSITPKKGMMRNLREMGVSVSYEASTKDVLLMYAQLGNSLALLVKKITSDVVTSLDTDEISSSYELVFNLLKNILERDSPEFTKEFESQEDKEMALVNRTDAILRRMAEENFSAGILVHALGFDEAIQKLSNMFEGYGVTTIKDVPTKDLLMQLVSPELLLLGGMSEITKLFAILSDNDDGVKNVIAEHAEELGTMVGTIGKDLMDANSIGKTQVDQSGLVIDIFNTVNYQEILTELLGSVSAEITQTEAHPEDGGFNRDILSDGSKEVLDMLYEIIESILRPYMNSGLVDIDSNVAVYFMSSIIYLVNRQVIPNKHMRSMDANFMGLVSNISNTINPILVKRLDDINNISRLELPTEEIN